MVAWIINMISLPEFGIIAGIAVILFGCKAISQNPILTKKQKTVWIATVIVLNWIGLLWYYYMFYVKPDKSGE